ncbi:polyprenyl synthetase family protein [Fuerstiella marisgermanici]|uniref:Octaprenyl-diphosphate synthase n=1 Tax=Fuerstiella marisgermanici TaxID=1891926 RepID=A0A1P8WD80_9PLAN|nr:polyprenyl synthetase family protein [Fuerstiella marisgermanici]APZ92038.1 Octaprenyl-diphosphate synthase [Fuerstiella marisgermanici]
MNASTLSASDLKKQLLEHLQGDLQAVNEVMRRKLETRSSFVSDVTQHVSRFQGKQIRPMLLLLTSRMISGRADRNAAMLAASVEMIHLATLVHDDVIDEAETRRHVTTVHRRWNTETSVLLGDYLFSKSFHLAASTGDAEACRLIGLATDRTCEGELNQSAIRVDGSTTETDYFRIIRDKTGQLFGLSCLLGARTADGNTAQQKAARRFGMRLGMAFQIADDVLDLTQTTAETGKDAGNDLQNGRLTLPLLRACQLASPETLFRNGANDRESLCEVEAVQEGIRSALETAEDLVTKSIRDLTHFPASADRSFLELIATFAVQRRS